MHSPVQRTRQASPALEVEQNSRDMEPPLWDSARASFALGVLSPHRPHPLEKVQMQGLEADSSTHTKLSPEHLGEGYRNYAASRARLL
jgi:hypothetical protein